MSNIIKLLILGHSYVKRLSKLKIENFTVGEEIVEVKYWYKKGADYLTILDKTSYLDLAEEYCPDFILVILAGNSLNNKKSNKDIYREIREFYSAFRERLPNSIIISAQVELRFYEENNRWDCPTAKVWRARRECINKFLNRLKLKDFVLNITGPGRLDQIKYYKDEVHLKSKGYRLYFELIQSTIKYIIRKKNLV